MNPPSLIRIPERITFISAISNGSLSPTNYQEFVLINKNKKNLRQLVSGPIIKGREVGSQAYLKNSTKYFVRTKALQQEYILINKETESIVPINPKFFIDYGVKNGDVLISKDSNVGEVVYIDEDLPNYSISAGINILRFTEYRYYILAFLKNDFFKKQLEILIPKGATIKHAKDKYLECFIPFPKNEEIIEDVTQLMKEWIYKERKIRSSVGLIDEILETEIFHNIGSKRNTTSGATYNELSNVKRFDTGIYSKDYKDIIQSIESYPGGYFRIPPNKFKSGSTPKDRVFGKGDKRWVTPSIVSKYGYMINHETIICKEQNIKKNCVLTVNRTSKESLGEFVGISIFYDFDINGKGHHNQGMYRIEDFPDDKLKLITILLNSKKYRKLCGYATMGSKMKEMKIKDFSLIPFPIFDDTLNNKLISNYDIILKESHDLIEIKDKLENYVLKITNDQL
jgi:type I restriction enzyme S subunit